MNYPECIPLDIAESMKKIKTHYTMRAECKNCGKSFGGIFILKGLKAQEYKKSLCCPDCEVCGMISVW